MQDVSSVTDVVQDVFAMDTVTHVVRGARGPSRRNRDGVQLNRSARE